MTVKQRLFDCLLHPNCFIMMHNLGGSNGVRRWSLSEECQTDITVSHLDVRVCVVSYSSMSLSCSLQCRVQSQLLHWTDGLMDVLRWWNQSDSSRPSIFTYRNYFQNPVYWIPYLSHFRKALLSLDLCSGNKKKRIFADICPLPNVISRPYMVQNQSLYLKSPLLCLSS